MILINILTLTYILDRSTAVYKGTVNDPTEFPPPSKSHGSYHWAFERLLSAGLIPLTAAAFVTSGSNYPVLDGILGVSLVMHSHIGVRIVKNFHKMHLFESATSLILPLLTISTSANSLSWVPSQPGFSGLLLLELSSEFTNSIPTTSVCDLLLPGEGDVADMILTI